MGSVRRIYVEKKQPYAVHAKELKEEVKRYLGIKSINNVRVLIRYDVENLSNATYKQALGTVFSEPPVDNCYENEFKKANGSFVFSVEYLPGQFDQRADSAEQCVKLLNEKENPVIRSATTYVFEGDIDDQDKEKIKEYCINPVDSREASENIPETLVQEFDEPADVAIFDGFRQMSEDELKKLYESLNLAMTFKDFLHIQTLKMRKTESLPLRRFVYLIHIGQTTAVIQHSRQNLRMLSLRMVITMHLSKHLMRCMKLQEKNFSRTDLTNMFRLWILHLWVCVNSKLTENSMIWRSQMR